LATCRLGVQMYYRKNSGQVFLENFLRENCGSGEEKPANWPFLADFHGVMLLSVLESQATGLLAYRLEKPRFCRNFAA
jgi:hypothetical protein